VGDVLVVRGLVKDQDGNGVGACRVEAVFDVRVTPESPALMASSANDRRLEAGGRRTRDTGGDIEGGGESEGGAVATMVVPKSYVTTSRVSTTTASDGTFRLDFPNQSDIESENIPFSVSAPSGEGIGALDVTRGGLDGTIEITVKTIGQIKVDPATGAPTQRKKIVGRVFDVRGGQIPPDLQVVVYATTDDGTPAEDATPVLLTRTDGGGYFTGEQPTRDLFIAFGKVADIKEPIEIDLVERALPTPLLLPIDLGELKLPDDKVCACEGGTVPRSPDQWDLANAPNTFSTDLGVGCVNFNVPNRALEEFDFYSVVRTTEPDIRGVTLGGVAANGGAKQKDRAWAILLARLRGRGLGPDGKLGGSELRVLMRLLVEMGLPEAAALLANTDEVDEETLARVLELVELQAMSSQVGLVGKPPGRVFLDGAQSVDWDSSPTFYEAVTVAHGHLLHFKQVWYADGYSLGDLLYSLPLAPGQKRLVSVVDWERREQATRSEEQSATESLNALLSRDRDLNEVVSGALAESMRGGSRATTWGVGGGMGGAGNGSYYGFNFGALHGISGGYGQSDSDAWEDASRNMSAQSLQSLRDKTLQSASAVRGLRSTAVYAATQGEAVRASTEIVANHNHCHALTIQYFEVLRHLKLQHELADVQECLFVPLPMEAFDRGKALRWRESLRPYCRRPELGPAFDSARRVDTNWRDVDYPAARYADELVTEVFGEFQLTILAPLPPLPERPVPKPGQTMSDAVAGIGQALNPTTGFLGGLLAVATGGLSLLAGAGANAIAQGAHAVAESLVMEPTAQERYDKFQHDVMPGVVVGFVDQLELYAVVNNNQVKLSGVDFTLVSDYRPGSPLLCSVRGRLSNQMKRADITDLVVKSANGLPDGCRAILNTASIRYRTSSFEHAFVSDWRVNDDIELPKISISAANFPAITVTTIQSGNGATLFTPIDSWEQRNPKKEDERLTADLVDHLNDNLEYYHHAIWWTMDPNRRYMLLDGFLAPNSGDRSVASVVDNQLIGIAGNSLIMPVARGVHLDPRFAPKEDGETIDLKAHYAPTTPIAPARVSLPTRGVFAEAVMGSCNACEKIDDTRYWRWEDSPLEEIPAPPSTDSRSTDLSGTVTPSALPAPIVSIQAAPAAPDPQGVKIVADLLAKEAFPDITGLAANQANAAAALQKTLETSLEFGKEASKLAQQAAMLDGGLEKSLNAIDNAESEGKISSDEAKDLRMAALKKRVGLDADSPSKKETEDKLDTVDKAAGKGSIDDEDRKELNKANLGNYLGIDPPKLDDEAVAKKIDEIEDPQKVEITDGTKKKTVTGQRTGGRTIAVTLTSRNADDSVFEGEFDLSFRHRDTGRVFVAGFDTSEGTDRVTIPGMPSGAYDIRGRILRTNPPKKVLASGEVALVGGSTFNLEVPFEVDATTDDWFKPTGSFTIRPGVKSIALLSQPSTKEYTKESTVSFSAGAKLEGEFREEAKAKLGGELMPGEVEAGESVTITAGGDLRGGQDTKFTITTRVITGIQIKVLKDE
jgi:hypothetical protein